MPGFVSHTIMAREVYNKIDNKHINLDYMVTYSLGGDLTKYAKCRYASHHYDMDKFIYEMARYIKEHKLINDDIAMGVLYGHICHYVMDDTIHPYVRKTDKLCSNGKRNHDVIELYYDNYLAHDRKEYLKKRNLNAKSNIVIDKMINTIYEEVYNTNNVAKYYHFNIIRYKIIRGIYIIFGNNLMNKIMGLNHFIKNNKDKLDDLVFKDDYDLSILLACEYIKNVNNYLH